MNPLAIFLFTTFTSLAFLLTPAPMVAAALYSQATTGKILIACLYVILFCLLPLLYVVKTRPESSNFKDALFVLAWSWLAIPLWFATKLRRYKWLEVFVRSFLALVIFQAVIGLSATLIMVTGLVSFPPDSGTTSNLYSGPVHAPTSEDQATARLFLGAVASGYIIANALVAAAAATLHRFRLRNPFSKRILSSASTQDKKPVN